MSKMLVSKTRRNVCCKKATGLKNTISKQTLRKYPFPYQGRLRVDQDMDRKEDHAVVG